MKAIIWTAYGPPEVLQLKEVEKPTPKDNEVLIKVFATTATAGDCEMRSLSGALWYALSIRLFAGLRSPHRIPILGMEFAGKVESAGQDVKRFKAGDQLFGATGIISIGAYAEYICLPEKPEDGVLALKPNNMTFEEAATVPIGGIEALDFLRQGNIQRGEKVLINGAGGTIGTFTVQLANYFGAEVTAVESTGKLPLVQAIGAHRVIDYTQEDFTKSGDTYDFILDVVSKGSYSGCLNSLNNNGRYLIASPGMSQMVRGRWSSITGNKKVIFGASKPMREDILFLKELIEAGNIKSVIDRAYPLEQAAEAHRFVETGQKKGHVVITVANNNES